MEGQTASEIQGSVVIWEILALDENGGEQHVSIVWYFITSILCTKALIDLDVGERKSACVFLVTLANDLPPALTQPVTAVSVACPHPELARDNPIL